MLKSTKQRSVSVILLIAIFITLLSPLFSFSAFADDERGFSPSTGSGTKYTTNESLTALPGTFEFTVNVPTDLSSSTAIISTYVTTARVCFNLALNANGQPYLSTYHGNSKNIIVTFDDVDLRNGEWTHVSVVIDGENSLALCYINGELKSDKSFILPVDFTPEDPIIIGGNYGASSFFKGNLLDVAIYSDVRSAEEIVTDYSTSAADDDLLYRFDFSGFDNSNPPETVANLAGSGNDLTLYSEFYTNPVKPIDDYAYSFAVVGDIQVVTYKNPDNLSRIYDWIVDNKDDKKIEFVFNLGDITEKNTPEEWAVASEAIHSLDGKVPYSIVRGNHDRPEDYYNENFKYSDYEDVIGGSYDGTMMTTYQTLVIGSHKYLILNLDYIMSLNHIIWARKIIEQHHDYNVIITTHIYLTNKGKLADSSYDHNAKKYGSDYNAYGLWEALISKYKNIVMVISGHSSSPTILKRERTGVMGNTVTELLVDPQGVDGTTKYENMGSLGLVAMLYFSEDGSIVQTQYYSTIQDKYFLPMNEFTMTLDTVTPEESGHSFPSTYTHDDNMHWHECPCGEKQDIWEHTLGEWIIIREATEEKPGSRCKDCKCGYIYTELYTLEPETNEGENSGNTGNTQKTDYTVTIVISVTSATIVAAVAVGAVLVIRKRKSN